MTSPLTVTPIPGEADRYFVRSESRDLEHVVDMKWQEGPRDKARPTCGCEEMQAKGRPTCKHVGAVVEYLKGEDLI